MEKVAKQFLKQPNVKIVGSEAWTFPIERTNVEFQTVIRSQMDVLMKMILKLHGRLQIKQPSEISELLAVETIFVEHMMKRLIHLNMLKNVDGMYELTPIGQSQLIEGTFTHDLLDEIISLPYSPFHEAVLLREGVEVKFDETEQLPRIVLQDKQEISHEQWKQFIFNSDFNMLVEAGQKQIENIVSVNVEKTFEAVCFEYYLYDEKEDFFQIRVWNTWTKSFDIKFEEEKMQQDLTELRQLYLEDS